MRGERRLRASGPARRACSGSASSVIDLYYLHRPPQTAEIEETVGAMAELVSRGQGPLPRPVRGQQRPAAPRVRGAPDHRRAERVLAVDPRRRDATCSTRLRELNVGLVPYSPLGRGFLTGTVDLSALDASDFRRHNPRFTGAAGQANQAIADTVREVADGQGRRPRADRAGLGLRPAGAARRPAGPHPGHQAGQVARAEHRRPRHHPDRGRAGPPRPARQPGNRRALLTPAAFRRLADPGHAEGPATRPGRNAHRGGHVPGHPHRTAGYPRPRHLWQ